MGSDLLQRIRRVHGDVPVIIATGLETWDLCTSAEAYGAVTCLMKPLDLDELVWTIEMALACRRGRWRAGERAAIWRITACVAARVPGRVRARAAQDRRARRSAAATRVPVPDRDRARDRRQAAQAPADRAARDRRPSGPTCPRADRRVLPADQAAGRVGRARASSGAPHDDRASTSPSPTRRYRSGTARSSPTTATAPRSCRLRVDQRDRGQRDRRCARAAIGAAGAAARPSRSAACRAHLRDAGRASWSW